MKLLAAILVLAGLAGGAAFLLTGAGAPPAAPTPLSAPLGPLAGSPLLAGAGALLFVLGTLLLGRGDETYPLPEVLLALAAGGAGALTAALVVGVAHRWAPETVGALAVGAVGETLVAVALAVRVATQPTRARRLFLPGVAGLAAVALVQLLVVTLGAA